MLGSNGVISSPIVRSKLLVGYDISKGRSSTVSRLSHVPSLSVSNGEELLSISVVPHSDSSLSLHPSSSSSSSSIRPVVDSPFKSSGIPSPSVSTDAAASLGKASGPGTQMLALGVAGPSQIPSASESGLLVPVNSSTSLMCAPLLFSSSFGIPSPSISSSRVSQVLSPSKSEGTEFTSCELVIQALSVESEKPSPSSSRSSTRSPM